MYKSSIELGGKSPPAIQNCQVSDSISQMILGLSRDKVDRSSLESNRRIRSIPKMSALRVDTMASSEAE